MARKQKLIHLHNSSALTTSAVNTTGMVKGEIAVRHAATNIDSELYILNDANGIVSFPSVEKVESLITGATSSDISGLKSSVSELEKTVSGYTSTNTVKAAIDGVNNDLQGKIDTINGLIGDGFSSTSTITSQLAAVKSTADTAKSTADTNTESINGIKSALGSLTGANAVPNAIAAAKTKVARSTDTATTNFLTVSDNSVTNPDSGVTYTLTLTDVASAKSLSNLSKKVGTNETDITALKALHADGKSVAQEVADGIAGVVAGAPDKFDTLKEIADWIANDTTGAAKMANDIADLKATLTGYNKTDTVQKAISTVNSNITTINSVLKGLNGESAVSNAINAAKTTITEANTGLILISSSTDTDGHINYTITPNGIASNSDLTGLTQTVNTLQTNLQDEVTNRKNADTAIQKQIGSGFTESKTVADAINAAKTTITTADTGFIRIASSADTDGHINYKFTANDIASANDLSTLNSAAAKSGKITVDSQEFKATSVDATNSLNFDLSNLVIDCGTY